LVAWVKAHFDIDCCRDTLRKVLKRLGFSWKKAHKLLNKGQPAQRAAFLERLQVMLDEALHQRCLLVYIDEAHIHLDTDAGYGWAIRGERFWVSSSSPGRAKVSFYGVYLYNLAQVRVFAYDKADQFHTIDVLKRLRVEFPDVPLQPWAGLLSVVVVQSHRRLWNKDSLETRYFLSSLSVDAPSFARYIRAHWGIENQLHWCLDVVFNEDTSRIRTDHAPRNMSLLRRLALNFLRQEPSKGSLAMKRYRAGLDDQFMLQILKANIPLFDADSHSSF
jgi:predicted transposase YbfD/YdcC